MVAAIVLSLIFWFGTLWSALYWKHKSWDSKRERNPFFYLAGWFFASNRWRTRRHLKQGSHARKNPQPQPTMLHRRSTIWVQIFMERLRKRSHTSKRKSSRSRQSPWIQGTLLRWKKWLRKFPQMRKSTLSRQLTSSRLRSGGKPSFSEKQPLKEGLDWA